MNQSPISQHLRKLKDVGLLENKREGLTIFYSIPQDKKEQLRKIITLPTKDKKSQWSIKG
jgi:ArsR family transcriptional regulator